MQKVQAVIQQLAVGQGGLCHGQLIASPQTLNWIFDCGSNQTGALAAEIDRLATPDAPGKALLMKAGEFGGLTARGWTRTLRLARTIADLDGCDSVLRRHIAEALIYRRSTTEAQDAFEARRADIPPPQETSLPAW